MSDSDNTLNLTTLNELKELLEEGLDELLEEYLDDTPNQLAQLREAVAANDVVAIDSIAHTLKGSSGNLGVHGVYQLCAALEQEAKEGVVADAAASLATIEAEFEKAKLALAGFMTE